MNGSIVNEYDLGAKLLAQLTQRAQAHGLSVQSELLRVIQLGLQADPIPPPAAPRPPLGTRIHQRFAAMGGVAEAELALPQREPCEPQQHFQPRYAPPL